jgi:hypothetical protein
MEAFALNSYHKYMEIMLKVNHKGAKENASETDKKVLEFAISDIPNVFGVKKILEDRNECQSVECDFAEEFKPITCETISRIKDLEADCGKRDESVEAIKDDGGVSEKSCGNESVEESQRVGGDN